MTFSWIILLCCSLSATVVFTSGDLLEVEGDPDLADYLREAIENFRSQMSKGIPEINMPVLDPLHLEDMVINVKENVATLQLRINEMLVRGLSNFTVNDIQPNLEELYIQINLTLPHLLINGEYNLNGRLMSIFPLSGDGNYSITVKHLNFSGVGQIKFAHDSIQMEVFTMDLNFEKISMNLGRNFLGGGRFGIVMQEVITGVGKDVFKLYKPLILRKLQDALKEKINEELNTSQVKNIIKDIIPMQG